MSDEVKTVEDPGRQSPTVIPLEGHISRDAGAPGAVDGYQPRAVTLLAFGYLRGRSLPEMARLLSTAQRRCDTAHRQFPRVREQLDVWQAKPGNAQDAAFLLGDAELAIIALDGAFSCLSTVRHHLRPSAGHWPKEIKTRYDAVTQLRNSYIHIDARALGRVKAGENPELAVSAFVYESLIKHRALTYGQWRLGVDREATDLLVATATYIQTLWDRLSVESR
jgi:hypothetical protein